MENIIISDPGGGTCPTALQTGLVSKFGLAYLS
jgi:hypothetical protein